MKSQRQLSNQNTLIENKVSRPLWRRTVLSGFALTCLVLSPTSRAVNPPPDGGYANQNTAEGEDALFSLSSGTSGNTAIGFDALYSNTLGDYNTAIGLDALYSNINGYSNTAGGYLALFSNTGGGSNTATGTGALMFNTTGSANTAIGYNALYFNSTAKNNTAIGVEALQSSSTGTNNTAIGVGHFSSALEITTSGSDTRPASIFRRGTTTFISMPTERRASPTRFGWAGPACKRTLISWGSVARSWPAAWE